MTTKFAAIRFHSWNDLFSFGRSLDNWFYRGQSCDSWSLTSSLERNIGVDHGSSWDWDHTERWMLRKFCGYAHNYLTHSPADNDPLEWLALMQHHGAPTRLLDCTFSFPVAAFFAACEGEGDFAIWAFNWKQFRESATTRFGLDIDPAFQALDFHSAMHTKANEFLTRKAEGALAFPIVPTHSNERQESQQGLFLFPCDTTRTIEENIERMVEAEGLHNLNVPSNAEPYDSDLHNSSKLRSHWIIKCILPKEERFKLLMDLHDMNIHEATLFPGFDGFAESLRFYTRRDRQDTKEAK
ncbi:MAG: FRG domain-containing protein [Kiritimatiellae bacterium]|jgi:hypothetical protein|nr:FRG domain-containing protein [Kiritimatiellia bacterium]